MTVVRRGVVDDAEQVWPLVRRFAVSFTPTRDGFVRTWRSVLGDHDQLAVVALDGPDGSDVTGYLLANRHPTFFADRPVVWVEEVMVDPQWRRHGVGRELMAAAERWARESGAAYVALATRRAAAFYATLGYEESAVFLRKVLPEE